MNRIERAPALAGYDEDFARWSTEQAALLRARRFDALDVANVAEEIESLGRSHEDEIESRMGVLLAHLLKWRFQPDGRTNSWRATILEQRQRIGRRVSKSPSLRGHPLAVLRDEYPLARLKASGETGLPEDAFPLECPFTIEQMLDPTYLPD